MTTSLTWGLCHSRIFFFYSIYLKTIFVFQGLIFFQTSPIHCLYALDLWIRSGIYFVYWNLIKEEFLFFFKWSYFKTPFSLNIDKGILAFFESTWIISFWGQKSRSKSQPPTWEKNLLLRHESIPRGINSPLKSRLIIPRFPREKSHKISNIS